MAITFHWLAQATTITALVMVRGTTNGVVSVACNGSVFSSSTSLDTTVNDGVVKVPVTGLSPATSYPIVITDAGGATVAGSVRDRKSVV